MGDGEGKKRKLNIYWISVMFQAMELVCFTHIIPFNPHRGLMKPLFVFTFVGGKAEVQRINVILPVYSY